MKLKALVDIKLFKFFREGTVLFIPSTRCPFPTFFVGVSLGLYQTKRSFWPSRFIVITFLRHKTFLLNNIGCRTKENQSERPLTQDIPSDRSAGVVRVKNHPHSSAYSAIDSGQLLGRCFLAPHCNKSSFWTIAPFAARLSNGLFSCEQKGIMRFLFLMKRKYLHIFFALLAVVGMITNKNKLYTLTCQSGKT